MYTFLICQDNSIVATSKERIMEKSNLVDKLQFIVEKEYNGFDMRDFQLVIEAFLPITHEIQVETLELADDNYKGLYYMYQLPLLTGVTKEAGDVQFSLSFIKSDLDDEGKLLNYVRRIETGVFKVLPVESWFAVPDSALTELTQLYLQNQQNIMALRDVANTLTNTAPNKIIINNNTDIRLAHDNTIVGDGIDISTLARLIKDADNNIQI